MAGNPIKHAMIVKAAQLAQDAYLADPDDDINQAALAFVAFHVRDGLSITRIATTLLHVSRSLLYDWIADQPDRKRVIALAREDSAHALVDDGLELLDGETDPRAASLASNRANYRRWLAGVRNRAEYGERAAPAIQVSFGSLHLQALQSPRASPALLDSPARPALPAGQPDQAGPDRTG